MSITTSKATLMVVTSRYPARKIILTKATLMVVTKPGVVSGRRRQMVNQ